MGMQGQLTKANFGYSVPIDAPLYTPFPVLYEDVSMLVFPYVTSADAAARVAADADAQPLDDHRASARYRRHLVATLTRRALLAAGAPERGAAA